jgi:hypothetical protein
LILSEGKRTATIPEAPVAAPVAKASGPQGIIPQAPAPPEEVRSLMAELMKDDGKLPEGVAPVIVEQAPVPRSYTKTEKTKRKKKKTLKVRTAQSIRMKEIWAAKRAKAEPITIAPIAA